MTPKLISENYTCQIGSTGDARILGMTECTNGEHSASGQYIAIVHVIGKPPERFDTDSFDSAVTMVAKSFGEPEDAVREALEKSNPKSARLSIEKRLAVRPQMKLMSPIQWFIRKLFAHS